MPSLLSRLSRRPPDDAQDAGAVQHPGRRRRGALPHALSEPHLVRPDVAWPAACSRPRTAASSTSSGSIRRCSRRARTMIAQGRRRERTSRPGSSSSIEEFRGKRVKIGGTFGDLDPRRAAAAIEKGIKLRVRARLASSSTGGGMKGYKDAPGRLGRADVRTSSASTGSAASTACPKCMGIAPRCCARLLPHHAATRSRSLIDRDDEAAAARGRADRPLRASSTCWPRPTGAASSRATRSRCTGTRTAPAAGRARASTTRSPASPRWKAATTRSPAPARSRPTTSSWTS